MLNKPFMLKKHIQYAAIGAVLAVGGGGYMVWAQLKSTAATAAYAPLINPADFVPDINNKFFTLKPGMKFTYQDKRGIERIELTVTNETKKLMGVTTRAVRVTEWRNGALKEDTTDWYAQDKAGNVWYFGEAVNNYKDGKLIHHTGSWEAGVNGAKPGIIMRADPKVGDSYRQEYYKGHAEDMGTVVATDKKITVPFGTFERCVQIKDSTPLSKIAEYKYYCPGVAFLVREETFFGGVEADLVGVSSQ
jgi:hypothetical protein